MLTLTFFPSWTGPRRLTSTLSRSMCTTSSQYAQTFVICLSKLIGLLQHGQLVITIPMTFAFCFTIGNPFKNAEILR